MSFHVYIPAKHSWLSDDESTPTSDFYSSASFTSRALAVDIANREGIEEFFVMDTGE